MNSIVFTIPDNEWISANDRLHWAAEIRLTSSTVNGLSAFKMRCARM